MVDLMPCAAFCPAKVYVFRHCRVTTGPGRKDPLFATVRPGARYCTECGPEDDVHSAGLGVPVALVVLDDTESVNPKIAQAESSRDGDSILKGLWTRRYLDAC